MEEIEGGSAIWDREDDEGRTIYFIKFLITSSKTA